MRLTSFFLPVVAASVLLTAAATVPDADAPVEPRAELAYLRQVNDWGPPTDPQLLFLLMGQYANAGRHLEGAVHLQELQRRFDARLDDTQRALYLTAIASLRAGGADQVFLLRRIGWIQDTLAMLDEAERLTQGKAFIVRWMSGIVRARLPAFFGERERAETDLRWSVDHPEAFPHPGWLREVHFELSELLRHRGDLTAADRERAVSGHDARPQPVTFTTPFEETPEQGHRFSQRRVQELVKDAVYLVSGFEFTEYYFVVSADRRELISIDAGTRPDAAREALEALRARVPDLPPLTTVFVTHAHWDHVGGQAFFRSLRPAPRFIGRANYAQELANNATATPPVLARFFGAGFRLQDVLDYKPDVPIDRQSELTVGGTRFVLRPTRGGETDDALLIEVPDAGVLFVGDVLMPYFGAPFVEEGSVEGMLDAIDQIAGIQPRLLLHGHEPLTRIFDSVAMLQDLRLQLAWLRDETIRRMDGGVARAQIQQSNLVPPTLRSSGSGVHLAYLLIRENLVNRLFDQRSGYWQNGLQGLEAVTDRDHGAALIDYLGVDESTIATGVQRMMSDGRHDLAAATLRWSQARLPPSDRLDALRRVAYLKLAEQYQEFNPFKYILYREQADLGTSTAAPRR